MNQTVQLLKALAEPTRLRIVALCRGGGDLAVSEFVRILGQSQPRVSRHLKLLTEAGALARIPEGSWVFYRINTDAATNGIVNALIISGAEVNENFARAARNIPNIDVLPVAGLNVYDILRRRTLVITKEAAEGIKARFDGVQEEAEA